MAFRPSAVSGRSLGGPMRGFDLEEEVARLRGERGCGGSPPRGGGCLGVVVLLAMRAGGRFEEHSTPGPISSVVRGGRILFAAGGEAGPGTVLTCDAGVRRGGPGRRRLPRRRGEGRAFGKHDPVTGALRTDLGAAATSAAGEGTVWSLRAGSDLNANLVRFSAGRGVGVHVNDETDVVFVGVEESGFVEADGREHALGLGELVFVPRGARRSTRGASEGFAYLTVHRRREAIRIRTRVEREATDG